MGHHVVLYFYSGMDNFFRTGRANKVLLFS